MISVAGPSQNLTSQGQFNPQSGVTKHNLLFVQPENTGSELQKQRRPGGPQNIIIQ
jgi:hypothetical protein